MDWMALMHHADLSSSRHREASIKGNTMYKAPRGRMSKAYSQVIQMRSAEIVFSSYR